jgi:FkbM family methyltransferase
MAKNDRWRSFFQKLLGFRRFLVFSAAGQILTLKRNPLFREFNHLLTLLPPDAHVLDIGANIGITTVPLARTCKLGQVISYEPVPPNFRALTHVVRLFGVRNARLINKALGATMGVVEMVMPVVNNAQRHGLSRVLTGTEIHPYEGRTYRVPLVRLDDELATLPRPITAIKMDVEEFEFQVLEGSRELITQDRPIILTELFPNDVRRQCFEFIQAYGYSINILTPEGKLIPFNPDIHKAINFFFLPPPRV